MVVTGTHCEVVPVVLMPLACRIEDELLLIALELEISGSFGLTVIWGLRLGFVASKFTALQY